MNPANADDKSIRWISSDENAVFVSVNGEIEVQGYNSATVTIYATSIDEPFKFAACAITVNKPPDEEKKSEEPVIPNVAEKGKETRIS